jgi:hypothetical protein
MAYTEKTKSGYLTHFLFYLKRSDILFSIVIFLSTFFIYESMAPTRLSSANFGSDGGDYLAAILTQGIPHPSGYPLYLILSDFIQKVFSNTFVWRQTQLSIIPSALSVVIVYFLARVDGIKAPVSHNWFIGSIAAQSIVFAPLYWSQSVIIEVYALNALFMCFTLLWLTLITVIWKNQICSKQVWICIFSWVCGLGLGNHTTYLFVYPMAIWGIYKLQKSDMDKKVIALCSIGWFSGLLTYIILPIRAASHPPVNWGDSSTIQGFFWLVTGGNYGRNLFSILPQEYFDRISTWILFIFKQFGFFGLVTGALGIFNTSIHKAIKWSTVYVFFIYSIFSIGYKTNDSQVYLIPALIYFAVWIGWGIKYLWQFKYKGINLGLLLSIFILINVCIELPVRYREINPNNGDLANYALTTLSNTPQKGVINPITDGETFALWYYQYGLKIRPDVKIISNGLLQYQWYRDQLKGIYPDIQIIQ